MEKTVIPYAYIDESNKIQDFYAKTSTEYISNPQNRYTKYIKEQFLQDSDCFDILNIASMLWNIVENAYIDGVGGILSDVDIDTRKVVKDFVSSGKIVFSLTKEDGVEEKSIEHIRGDTFAVIDGIPTVFFDIEKEEKKGIVTYRFVKEYYVGENTNKLYIIDNGYEKEVPLDTLEELDGIEPVEKTGMKELSIAWHEQVSVFSSIESIVNAIERKIVSVDTEIIKFVKQKHIITGAGKATLDRDTWDNDFVRLPDASAKVEVLKYVNDKYAEIWDIIERQIQLISGNTKITMDDFGIESSVSVGVEAQKVRKSGYINRINTIRGYIESTYKTLSGDDIVFRWEDVIVQDKKSLAEELVFARDNGLITDVQAIIEYNNLSNEEAIIIKDAITTNTEVGSQE